MNEDEVLRHVHIDADDPVDVDLLKAVVSAAKLLYDQAQPFNTITFRGLKH